MMNSFSGNSGVAPEFHSSRKLSNGYISPSRVVASSFVDSNPAASGTINYVPLLKSSIVRPFLYAFTCLYCMPLSVYNITSRLNKITILLHSGSRCQLGLVQLVVSPEYNRSTMFSIFLF